ncbi:MAG: NADH-quinone oxidoreductase subunit NuoG [Proteobacteria bacterium]|nr:NADH-quinone oxidoreductase subunit NuoG [Pseudomonadota bacterium]
MALVTLNGKEIQVDGGRLILDVAREAGFEIPTFCYHAKLSTLASCRMCLVEIEGMRKLQASCATPVMDGMKIETESPDVVSARASQLEFLLINHPLDCPVCDQAGECDLQDLTFKYAKPGGRYRWKKRTFDKRDMGSTMTKEINRCIACRRCSRYCEEVSGDFAITELNRGNALEMGSFYHSPIESEFIGNTVQLCPVGALTSSLFRFKSRVWDLISTETICPHCSVGCSITSESKYVSQKATHMLQTQHLGKTPALEKTEVKILRNIASDGKGVTEISLCDRGRYGYHYINSDIRLKAPMVKENGRLVESTWEKALSLVASKLASIKAEKGAESIGGITSGICSNEDNFIFQKFFRNVIGTNNIAIPGDYSLSRSSVLRLLAMRGQVQWVKTADCILILGSSVGTDTPIVSMHAGMASRLRGANLITAMAGENRLLDTTAQKRLNYVKGSELTVIGALTRAVIDGKLYCESFGGKRKKELDVVEAGLKGINLKDLEVLAGLAVDDIESTARSLSEASKGVVLFGDDFIAGEKSEEIVEALYNLFSLLGYRGEKGQAIFSPASGNLIGSMDMGIAPDYLPGYVAVGSKEAGKAPQEKGLDWNAMVPAASDGKLQALYVMGDDPVETASDKDKVKNALNKLDFIVVQDLFMTKTAELADVVLPALTYAEKSGTVTNLEGRVQLLDVSMKPRVDGRKDWQIIRDVAQSMGAALCFNDDLRIVDDGEVEVLEEISKTVPHYAAVTQEAIGRDGLMSDVSGIKQAALKTVEIVGHKKTADKDYPLQVVPGRDVFLNGSMTWRDEGLLELSPGPRILVESSDGAAHGLSDGDVITVETKEGTLKGTVSLTDRIFPGVVVVPVNHPELESWKLFGGKNQETLGRLAK